MTGESFFMKSLAMAKDLQEIMIDVCIWGEGEYRVAHLLWERDMLTPNLKLRSAATPARPARPVTEL